MAAQGNWFSSGRVGTFAVTVGVGTVIAFGTAAPAWAADDGESPSAAATSAESSETPESSSTDTRTSDPEQVSDTDEPADEPESPFTDTRTSNSERASDEDEPVDDGVGVDHEKPVATEVRPIAASTTDAEPAAPELPQAAPALWSLLGTARREATDTGAPPQQDTTETVTELAALPDAPHAEPVYTGRPSFIHDVVTFGLYVLKAVLKPFGSLLRFTSLRIPIFTDGIPPFFVRGGLDVEFTEFEGMKVWTLTPRRDATDRVIVALHGGSYEGEVNVFQWSTYADMARDTGATVVVPLYTLAPKGTAATEVPRTANLIAKYIDDHGAENVSVLGDSAGGGLALAALQELARRNSRQPSRLVLLAPWLDVSMSDPRSAEIRDPLLDVPNLARPGAQWAGAASPADPMASPLFGELRGLPPMYVYSSSLDLLTVDTLRLRDRVLAEGIPDVAFRLRAGLVHDWLIFPFLPDAHEDRAGIYRDLLGAVETSRTTVTG